MRWLIRKIRRSPAITSRYATGGIITTPPGATFDTVPAYLGQCGYTLRRPGETWAQATDRLRIGEDL